MEFLLALVAGIIVACLMEIWKIGYRKNHSGFRKVEDVGIPSNMAQAAGIVFSGAVATILWVWKLRPDENAWAILWYGLGIFCFQYFVSMEIVKKIAKRIVVKETGINLD